MVNILLSGALGKMGNKVQTLSKKYDNLSIVCGIDKQSCDSLDFPVYSSFSSVKEKVDVIIDFSSPDNLSNILQFATTNKVPCVLCSTGLTDSDKNEINKASKIIPIFRSANMSFGVNVLLSLIKKASALLSDTDIEIIEKHHNQKKDAPSGTAIMMANAVKEELNNKVIVSGRSGNDCKRQNNEISISSVRGGNIVGEHEIMFIGNNETLTISHSAFDREVFAEGAIKASVYIVNQKPGEYNMDDLINFND